MNRYITSLEDLITTHEQTRIGFLSIALEKNMVGDPYVKQALAFKSMVSHTKGPEDFLTMPSIRPFMLAAAGLSDKSLQYLNSEDHIQVIKELIDKFLKPAGTAYIDETIYRFLLTKGDAVGGVMRNRIGAMGQEKLVRCILSCMNVRGISYEWVDNTNSTFKWLAKCNDDTGIEKTLKALYWINVHGSRVLGFNMTNSIVTKNIDICLYDTDKVGYEQGKIAKKHPEKAVMLGELKGGIDPAGADEHWKTANTALERIRTKYANKGLQIKTSFIGAAIEKSMAEEIYMQLRNGTISNSANLNDTNQLVEYCNWLLDL
ncbi:AvaI/BsoBI family type II restriction endonuclease [Brachyspira pulli]|uniref:AvaI/BsoBI family type II restriction endonuclease n=1 Tax=Brachyspira pulli TaxID=310721 RepID=UPI0030052054